MDPPLLPRVAVELTELASVASLTPSISLMRWSISRHGGLAGRRSRRGSRWGRFPAGVAEVTDADALAPPPLELDELELEPLELELLEELFEEDSLVDTTVPVSAAMEICGRQHAAEFVERVGPVEARVHECFGGRRAGLALGDQAVVAGERTRRRSVPVRLPS